MKRKRLPVQIIYATVFPWRIKWVARALVAHREVCKWGDPNPDRVACPLHLSPANPSSCRAVSLFSDEKKHKKQWLCFETMSVRVPSSSRSCSAILITTSSNKTHIIIPHLLSNQWTKGWGRALLHLHFSKMPPEGLFTNIKSLFQKILILKS